MGMGMGMGRQKDPAKHPFGKQGYGYGCEALVSKALV
jgi:hypothetical protein